MSLHNIDDMYVQMRALYNGCSSTIDAMNISECLFETYPEHKQLIISYRDSLIFPDTVDTTTKIASIASIVDTTDRDKAIQLKNSLTSRSTDTIYSKSLERAVHSKRKYHTNITYAKEYMTRICPHCGVNMRMEEDTKYVICGYPDPRRGYDWRGCGADWCFQCEKMLCKTWERDELNIEFNRQHDSTCCKNHAKKSGYDYEKDYCHCPTNNNVLR